MRVPVEALLTAAGDEARREPFPIDREVYAAAGRDVFSPVLFGGDTGAPFAFLGRDLGREEVRHGEPLIGPAGKLVRAGLERAGGRALLTNTVPFKPPGNKAYSAAVKRRFRPIVAALLVGCWTGDTVITLGNKAFEWFGHWDPDRRLRAFWADEEARYREEIAVEVETSWGGRRLARVIRLAPLPHPSPLNARWYKRFPALLDARLAGR